MTDQISLKQRIQEDMKNAMRAQDKPRLDAIRLILAAIKQIEVDERIEVDNTRVLAILDKMLKQRRDSIEQYQAAKREDLVKQEEFEVNVIQSYLPAALSDEELEKMIGDAIAATTAVGVKDMGKVMAELKPKVQGRADMAKVGTKIKERLG
jgi:uncharacterized protein YqeY